MSLLNFKRIVLLAALACHMSADVVVAQTRPGLLVFAAASLRDSLETGAKRYEQDGGQVRLSFAGSAVIARQIAAGAPADIVVLANKDWMDWLESRGAIQGETRHIVAGNSLALLTPAGKGDVPAIESLPELLGTDRLAVARTDVIPAGIYAREALQHHGLWDALKGQLIETENTRITLALVARGEVPFGIGYVSDAAASDAVDVAYVFDPASHSPIAYPAAITAESTHPESERFMDFLMSDAMAQIFAEAGFSPVPQ